MHWQGNGIKEVQGKLFSFQWDIIQLNIIWNSRFNQIGNVGCITVSDKARKYTSILKESTRSDHEHGLLEKKRKKKALCHFVALFYLSLFPNVLFTSLPLLSMYSIRKSGLWHNLRNPLQHLEWFLIHSRRLIKFTGRKLIATLKCYVINI